MRSSLDERQVRADHEVPNRLGHENFRCGRSGGHARADDNGEPADLFPHFLDLSGMEPRAHLEP